MVGGGFLSSFLVSRLIPPYNYNRCVGDADLRPLQCPPQSWDGTEPRPLHNKPLAEFHL